MITTQQAPSNLSNAEYFRLFGTLSADRIEKLLEHDSAYADIKNITTLINESRVSIAPDALQNDISGLLIELKGKLRGDNRLLVEESLEILGSVFDELANAIDYHHEQAAEATKLGTKLLEKLS